MTDEMARAISMCIVCGDDIINNRCQCSDFADWRAGRVPQTLGPLLFLSEINAEGQSVVRPLLYAGSVRMGDRRVPVLEVALGARERLVDYSKKSHEFSIRYPAVARYEDARSSSANPDRTTVH